MPTATLTSKGQITLPKDARERLGVVKGDVLELTYNSDGSIRLKPLIGSVRALAGLLHRPGQRTVSLEEMQASILESRAEDEVRIRSSS